MTRLVLASTSPARLSLLRAGGIEPITISPGVDEEAVAARAESMGLIQSSVVTDGGNQAEPPWTARAPVRSRDFVILGAPAQVIIFAAFPRAVAEFNMVSFESSRCFIFSWG